MLRCTLVYWENVLGIVLFCVQWALIHSGDHHHMCVRTRQVPTDTLYAVLRHRMERHHVHSRLVQKMTSRFSDGSWAVVLSIRSA